ncbi:MAG: RDAC family protein [Eubacteriaceae bacterium]
MIITWNDIIALNNQIKAQGFKDLVHLSDACGRQSMWIEGGEEDGKIQDLNGLHELIKNYFETLKIEIEFSWDKKSFWTKDRGLNF